MQKIITLDNASIIITNTASSVGHEEFFGPLGDCFDFHDDSDRFGAKTWELSEGELCRITLNLVLKKAKMRPSELDLLFAGDLQNQCVATAQGLCSFGIPYVGLYGACSTCGEGLLAAATFLNSSKALSRCAVVTSSHNCAAERQFRTPIEYGGQRTPTAQWTATAAGAFILEREETDKSEQIPTKEQKEDEKDSFSENSSDFSKQDRHSSATSTDQKHSKDDGRRVRITRVMAGKIVDGGVTDASNMGAAMAPAAADSICTFFECSGESAQSYDAIITGDLGLEGSRILVELLESVDVRIKEKHLDCGVLMYDFERQDAHSGASGCGCSASILASHFIPQMKKGKYKRVLFIATGALMSPSSIQQGGSISAVAPVVELCVI